MDFIQELREKIKQYEEFRKDFAQEPEKRIMMSLFVAELKTLENDYFKELNSNK